VAVAAVLFALGADGAAGCGTAGALALARQACSHVQRSIELYQASQSAGSPANQQGKADAALAELRMALPLAASAAGQSPQWQALMTTLTESSRVPESDLVRALTQQCADARAGGQPIGPPVGPGTTTIPPLPKPKQGA
jgi:hypothetical protein